MMKKTISLLLLFCMLFAWVPQAGRLQTQAEEAQGSDALQACRQYMDYLKQYQSEMELYERMHTSYKTVLIEDINRDKIPELFVCQPQTLTGNGQYQGILDLKISVFTYRDHTMQTLAVLDHIVIGAGGGANFALLQTDDPANMVFICNNPNESGAAHYQPLLLYEYELQ